MDRFEADREDDPPTSAAQVIEGRVDLRHLTGSRAYNESTLGPT
jgi:hypothetical protein